MSLTPVWVTVLSIWTSRFTYKSIWTIHKPGVCNSHATDKKQAPREQDICLPPKLAKLKDPQKHIYV